MDINDLLEDFAEAVADDDDLSQWSITTYGQKQKVYVNIDVRNPPGEDDCPYVVLYPISKNVGQDVGVKEHGFEAVCCIHDSTSKTYIESNIIEYHGVKRVETMRKYVETAIAGVDIRNAVISTVDVEYETIESFPYVMAGMIIGITKECVIGEDRLL